MVKSRDINFRENYSKSILKIEKQSIYLVAAFNNTMVIKYRGKRNLLSTNRQFFQTDTNITQNITS